MSGLRAMSICCLKVRVVVFVLLFYGGGSHVQSLVPLKGDCTFRDPLDGSWVVACLGCRV